MSRQDRLGRVLQVVVITTACATMTPEGAGAAAPNNGLPPAVAPVPVELVMDSTSERLRSTLSGAPELRVMSNGRVLVLQRPIIGIDGISFHHVNGEPRPRPAFITADWERPAPPPNPLPWSEIDDVERPVTRISPAGIVLGFGAGWLLGSVLRFQAAWAMASITRSAGATYATYYMLPLATGALGAFAMGRSREWERIYTSSGQGDRSCVSRRE